MRRKSRAPFVLTFLFVVFALIGFFGFRIYDGRLRESLTAQQVMASNTELDASEALVQSEAKAQTTADLAFRANPTDPTVTAEWVQKIQNYDASLTIFSKRLQKRFNAEKHLGVMGDTLRLQLSDMLQKLVASSVGGVSIDSLMSAEPNLISAASDGMHLLESIKKIK